jgi:glycosyltransferase involved in cell wall biosynthesis
VVASDLYMLPLGRGLSAGTQVPLLYEAREDWAALKAARRPRALRAAVTQAESALARGAAAVIVPGESRARRWRRVGVDPVVFRNVGVTVPREDAEPKWDVAYVGLLAEQRRPDLVLELAARRPDLRFVMGGAGRLEPEVRVAADGLPNVDFLGFVEDVDAVLASAKVIIYGEDPTTPYSDLACPNTLYQAVRLRRALVFFCAGEPEAAARRFRVGLRCPATADGLSAAVDEALERDDWEFDTAWSWLRDGAEDALQARLRELVPELR